MVPVPTFIEREQINVADNALLEHLDAYTAPRLVEYHDPDPCARYEVYMRQSMDMPASSVAEKDAARGRALGVTIEASYTVGEYDILILSAEESGGLIKWLTENDYNIPKGAQQVVDSYLKQDMRFFVAKVNLQQQSKLGYAKLRPLQVAYESNKFMLPIRLGTLNARGKQELYVYTLTKTGRVETTNYRTVKLAERQRGTGVRAGRVRRLLSRHVHARDGERERARRISRVRLGHGVVRPLRRRSAEF